jgi:periplasmic protein TonB
MIRLVLLSLLVPTSASMVLAQNSDSNSVSRSSSITCPVETGPPPTTMQKWVAVSTGVMAGRRIGGKDPKYPSDAKRAHVEGRVVIVATVSASGVVEELCVSQGPEMLRQAAFDAVKTWKYKPIEVNGQAVEVKTQMNVDFEFH